MQNPIGEIKQFAINHLDDSLQADTLSMRRHTINPRLLREKEMQYTRAYKLNSLLIAILSLLGVSLAFVIMLLTESPFTITNGLISVLALLFIIISHLAISQRNRNISKNLFIIRLLQKMQEDNH